MQATVTFEAELTFLDGRIDRLGRWGYSRIGAEEWICAEFPGGRGDDAGQRLRRLRVRSSDSITVSALRWRSFTSP